MELEFDQQGSLKRRKVLTQTQVLINDFQKGMQMEDSKGASKVQIAFMPSSK